MSQSMNRSVAAAERRTPSTPKRAAIYRDATTELFRATHRRVGIIPQHRSFRPARWPGRVFLP